MTVKCYVCTVRISIPYSVFRWRIDTREVCSALKKKWIYKRLPGEGPSPKNPNIIQIRLSLMVMSTMMVRLQ